MCGQATCTSTSHRLASQLAEVIETCPFDTPCGVPSTQCYSTTLLHAHHEGCNSV